MATIGKLTREILHLMEMTMPEERNVNGEGRFAQLQREQIARELQKEKEEQKKPAKTA